MHILWAPFHDNIDVEEMERVKRNRKRTAQTLLQPGSPRRGSVPLSTF